MEDKTKLKNKRTSDGKQIERIQTIQKIEETVVHREGGNIDVCF